LGPTLKKAGDLSTALEGVKKLSGRKARTGKSEILGLSKLIKRRNEKITGSLRYMSSGYFLRKERRVEEKGKKTVGNCLGR